MNDWIKTDDLQYVRMKDSNNKEWELIEGRYAEDKYLLCSMTLDLSDYFEKDGTYDKELENIIKANYGSVENFDFTDEDTRNQLLAEMIFESTPYYETSWSLVEENEIEEKIKENMEERR